MNRSAALAPVVVFVYNRIWHTQRTIETLKMNILAPDSDLFIFSDGPRNTDDKERVGIVREFLHTISGFKSVSVFENSENIGLAESIIAGVTRIVADYGRVIVLEDDMETNPYFLRYMNDALNLYVNDERVISIHGYVYPLTVSLATTFFLKGADCWGWGTWKRGWDLFEKDGAQLLERLRARNLTREFDFNDTFPYTAMLEAQIAGQNNSWAIRWYASAFLAGMLTLYPNHSLIKNIGTDGSGTHCEVTSAYTPLSREGELHVEKISVIENLEARKAFEKFFRTLKNGRFARLKNKIRRILWF